MTENKRYLRNFIQSRTIPNVDARVVLDVQVSDNAEEWLLNLGFEFAYEYYKEGFRFGASLADQHGFYQITVFVSKVKKFLEKSDKSKMEDITDGYLVEVVSEDEKEVAHYRVIQFAKIFSSFVEFTPDATAPSK